MFDLSLLRALPLRKLVVSGCPVSDLAPLADHPTLEHVDLSKTRVNDVSPLFGCPRLCRVDLWDAEVSAADAEALVRSIKRHDATPSPLSDYHPYVSHRDINWYEIDA